MIKVSGTAMLRVYFDVDLEMTEDEFDALTSKEQDALIGNYVDWQDACRSAEIDEIEVEDIEEEAATA